MKKELSEKRKAYLKEYQEKNREAILMKKRLFYSNPENKAKAKEYREKNKEKLKQKSLKYYQDNKDSLLNKANDYYLNNKDKVANKNKKYRSENKEKIKPKKAKYEREKREKDPLYKIKHNVRSMIRRAFVKKGYKKTTKSYLILGCSYDVFKTHIESLWQPWMSWDNYGLYNGTENYGWDIDHIQPLKTAITENDVIQLSHYSNLQPLCSYISRDVKKWYIT